MLDDRKKEPEYQKEIEKEDKKEKEEESQHRKYENKRCIYYFPSCQEGN